jgi:hypothetical protein
MSLRKARAELKGLRDTVAPKRASQIFLRVVGETDDDGLARHRIDEWLDLL